MADPLFELLAPFFDRSEALVAPPSVSDQNTTSYLARLSTLSLQDLTSTEPQSLLQAAQSHLRSLQALSKRSHKAVIASSSHLQNLKDLLLNLGSEATDLRDSIPKLESAATDFAQKYDRSTENAVLDRRKRATLLARNADRVSDVLDLPTLLSSTVSAAQNTGSASGASSATSYASVLDLHAHIKRLDTLYPHSGLVGSISKRAEAEIDNLTAILITSLQSPNLKLAGAMRTVGWLRRVAPDLADDSYGAAASATLSTKSISLSTQPVGGEGTLGSVFLVCRLRTLNVTLEALEPLRELADQENFRRKQQATNGKAAKQQAEQTSYLGTQSERYLKRYIEIFREQSFNIISMYKSIFPSALPTPSPVSAAEQADSLLPLPSPVSSFALHLVDMLTGTLEAYMPNVTDRQARDSLLTQVMYCAGSLGRQGADFSMIIAVLGEGLADNDAEDAEPEWVLVMKKHRVQAGRLEVLARGVESGRKGSLDVQSPTALSPG